MMFFLCAPVLRFSSRACKRCRFIAFDRPRTSMQLFNNKIYVYRKKQQRADKKLARMHRVGKKFDLGQNLSKKM